MAFQLSTFKGALEHGGARPSLFDFRIDSFPSSITLLAGMQYHVNVTAIPPLTVTPIERQYFGRTVKIPGDMVFGDLTTTIINTTCTTSITHHSLLIRHLSVIHI